MIKSGTSERKSEVPLFVINLPLDLTVDVDINLSVRYNIISERSVGYAEYCTYFRS